MRFGSVCSGIEAASVAWHPLGWRAAWLAEIEPFPCAVLAQPGSGWKGDFESETFITQPAIAFNWNAQPDQMRFDPV